MLSWFKTAPKKAAADDSEETHATRVETPQTTYVPQPILAPAAEAAPAASETEPTPHDIALASVDARLQHLDDVAQRPNRRATLDTTSDGTSQFHSLPTESLAHTPRPSSTFIEHAYDPYSGNAVGVLTPVETDSDNTQDALWGHLANIRELQSEIAQMHVEMEKLGEKQDQATQEAARDFEEDFPTFGAETDAQKRGTDAQKRETERQEKEFNDLAMRFKERKDGIENIMKKVRLRPHVVMRMLSLMRAHSCTRFRRR